MANEMRIAFVVRAVDAASSVVSNISAKTGALVRQVQGSAVMREKLRGASDAMVGLGAATAAAGAGMAVALAAPVKAMAEMEETMTRARLPYLGAKGVDPVWTELEPIIERLGNKLPGTTADFGEIAGAMKTAGLAGRFIRDGGLEAAAALKILGKLTNEEAGFLSVQMGRALKVRGEDYSAFADDLQRTSFGAGIAIRELATSIPYMGAQLQQFEITGLRGAKGVTTVMAMLKDAGINGSEIGTAVGGLLDRLPILQERLVHGRGWKAQEGAALLQRYNLGNLGAQLFDEKGQLRGQDGMERLFNVVAVFDRINRSITSTKDKAMLFDELLGDVAKRAGLAFTLQNWDAARDKIIEQASLETRLREVLGSTTAKWEAFTGSGRTFIATVAAPMKPMIDGVLESLNSLLGRLTAWSKEHPRLSAAIFTSVGVVAALLLVVGALALGVGLLGKAVLNSVTGLSDWKALLVLSRQAIRGVGTEAVLTSGKLGLMPKIGAVFAPMKGALAGAVAMGWPFVAILAAVAGLTLLIYKNREPLKHFFRGFGEGFKADVSNVIMPELVRLKAMGGGLWDGLKDSCASIVQPLLELRDLFRGTNREAGGAKQAAGQLATAFNMGAFAARYLSVSVWAIVKAVQVNVLAVRGLLAILQNMVTVFMESFLGPTRAIVAFKNAYDAARGKGTGHIAALNAAGLAATASAVATTRGVSQKIQDPWLKLGPGVQDLFTPPKFGPTAQEGGEAPPPPGKGLKVLGATPAGNPLTNLLRQSQGAGGKIEVNYNPKMEFRGNVTEEDKTWFLEQLKQQQTEIVRIVDEAQQRRVTWNGAE